MILASQEGARKTTDSISLSLIMCFGCERNPIGLHIPERMMPNHIMQYTRPNKLKRGLLISSTENKYTNGLMIIIPRHGCDRSGSIWWHPTVHCSKIWIRYNLRPQSLRSAMWTVATRLSHSTVEESICDAQTDSVHQETKIEFTTCHPTSEWWGSHSMHVMPG